MLINVDYHYFFPQARAYFEECLKYDISNKKVTDCLVRALCLLCLDPPPCASTDTPLLSLCLAPSSVPSLRLIDSLHFPPLQSFSLLFSPLLSFSFFFTPFLSSFLLAVLDLQGALPHPLRAQGGGHGPGGYHTRGKQKTFHPLRDIRSPSSLSPSLSPLLLPPIMTG